MSKLKLKLTLTIFILVTTTGCGVLSQAAKTASPTLEKPTKIKAKVVRQPTAVIAGQPTATVPVDTTEPTTRATKTPRPALTTTTGDPLKILKGAPDKINALKSYRIKGLVTGGTDSQQDGQLLMEVISPDRAHLSLPSFEWYSIGNTEYYKFGANAPWMKGAQVVSGRNPLGIAVIDPRQMIANAVKQAGSNTGQPVDLNGMPMLLYSWTAVASDPNSDTGSLWVGVADGLPYKLLDVEQDGTNVELDYYDFNANFKIEPPIP